MAVALLSGLLQTGVANAVDLSGYWQGIETCTEFTPSTNVITSKVKREFSVELSLVEPESFYPNADDANYKMVRKFAAGYGEVYHTLNVAENPKTPGSGEGMFMNCAFRNSADFDEISGDFGYLEFNAAHGKDRITARRFWDGGNSSYFQDCMWSLERVDTTVPEYPSSACPSP